MTSFQDYFPEQIVKINKLQHSGNNELWAIDTASRQYILKLYARSHMAGWCRLKIEYAALTYLWNKGFREIPEPLFFSEQDNLAIYSREKGKTIKGREIKDKHIESTVEFLSRLHLLGNQDKVFFGPASEACLSLNDYLVTLHRRYSSIMQALASNPTKISREGMKFLQKQVKPCLDNLERFPDFSEPESKLPLSLDDQVLSPADFGFHNILFLKDRATFVDFEYFGRDDPARQILDFLHHDTSRDIKPELKDIFLKRYVEKTRRDKEFIERLKLLDPFVGLAWVLIYMNIFLKNPTDEAKIRERLSKAQIKIRDLRYFTK